MTRQEYLRAFAQLVTNSDPFGNGIKASTLGNLALRSIPGIAWRQLGYSSFKEMLSELESSGAIRTGPNPKDQALTVWPRRPDACTSRASTEARRHPRLRGDVWAAFVNGNPPGSRYFDKTTGNILLGQARPPSPSEHWVEIPLISAEEQKSWARDLLAENTLAPMEETLAGSLWYLDFPKELLQVNPELVSQWNRLRTTRVTKLVTNWCSQHDIDPRTFIAVPPARQHVGQGSYDPQLDASYSCVPRSARHAVLDALAKMSTDELMALPIPAKYLLDSADR